MALLTPAVRQAYLRQGPKTVRRDRTIMDDLHQMAGSVPLGEYHHATHTVTLPSPSGMPWIIWPTAITLHTGEGEGEGDAVAQQAHPDRLIGLLSRLHRYQEDMQTNGCSAIPFDEQEVTYLLERFRIPEHSDRRCDFHHNTYTSRPVLVPGVPIRVGSTSDVTNSVQFQHKHQHQHQHRRIVAWSAAAVCCSFACGWAYLKAYLATGPLALERRRVFNEWRLQSSAEIGGEPSKVDGHRHVQARALRSERERIPVAPDWRIQNCYNMAPGSTEQQITPQEYVHLIEASYRVRPLDAAILPEVKRFELEELRRMRRECPKTLSNQQNREFWTTAYSQHPDVQSMLQQNQQHRKAGGKLSHHKRPLTKSLLAMVHQPSSQLTNVSESTSGPGVAHSSDGTNKLHEVTTSLSGFVVDFQTPSRPLQPPQGPTPTESGRVAIAPMQSLLPPLSQSIPADATNTVNGSTTVPFTTDNNNQEYQGFIRSHITKPPSKRRRYYGPGKAENANVVRLSDQMVVRQVCDDVPAPSQSPPGGKIKSRKRAHKHKVK